MAQQQPKYRQIWNTDFGDYSAERKGISPARRDYIKKRIAGCKAVTPRQKGGELLQTFLDEEIGKYTKEREFVDTMVDFFHSRI
jgi:hypothetical protein